MALDPRHQQVVTNLMMTAIRYGRPSGVIRIASEDVTEGRRLARVSVEDDGPGIRPADRERLFAPYVRGGDRGEVPGLGIGLALCRRIVDAHGGRIHVEEGELGGACFVFELPLESASEHFRPSAFMAGPEGENR